MILPSLKSCCHITASHSHIKSVNFRQFGLSSIHHLVIRTVAQSFEQRSGLRHVHYGQPHGNYDVGICEMRHAVSDLKMRILRLPGPCRWSFHVVGRGGGDA
nr:hypothetical protein Iba_chr01cCG17810 [Ipomoea batatas]GMC56264.1 hypothetical protein Iba_chr01fCG5420 [Ipomoea batatas]GMD18211.1 hypothetical protein Iba_scaffold1082485CG0010 [Ipomoea batatas]